MDIYLKNKAGTIDAKATFDPDTGTVIVKKGSIIWKELSTAPSFKSRQSMLKKREGTVINGVLQEDVVFTSLSTSATFIVGINRDGWKTWRSADGKTMTDVFRKKCKQ